LYFDLDYLVNGDNVGIITPFLYRVFSENAIPDIHLFTNAKERLVFAYAQSASDQMAYTDGCVRGDPAGLRWNYTCILITDTVSWNEQSVHIFLSHMKRDGAGSAYVVASNTNSVVYQTLRNYALIAPVRLRPVDNQDTGAELLMLLLYVSTRRRKAFRVVEMDSTNIGDIRNMFRLRSSEAVLNSRRVLINNVNERLEAPSARICPWWESIQDNWHVSGCGDEHGHSWIYTPLDNRRFMRPGWMRGWYHDKKALPNLNDIRCPGNARALLADPLPEAPTDPYSLKVMIEAVQPHPDIFVVKTPLNIDRFEQLLSSFPNAAHSRSWVRALRYGLWPWSGNFAGDSAEGVIIENPVSMNQHRVFINSIREKEVAMGHWRQLSVVPKYFRNSPLSVVPKPEGGNRLIQNLSFPEGSSVNDQIPIKEGKVTYDDIGALATVIIVLHSMGLKNLVPWYSVTVHFVTETSILYSVSISMSSR